jgi:hypothetical protein
MRRFMPLLLGAAGVGFGAMLYAAYRFARSRPVGRMISTSSTPSTPTWVSVPNAVRATSTPGGSYMPSITIPKAFFQGAGNKAPIIVASAIKWAATRGIPVQEVLATIQVESTGNPCAWANKANEDSRGLMQINVRAWGSMIAQRGLTLSDTCAQDDLRSNIDANIELGTYIYAKYRKEVQNLIAKSGVPQAAPIDVLTRLYYKGPAYVKKKILAGVDASSPYKDAERAVANWKLAMSKASAVV